MRRMNDERVVPFHRTRMPWGHLTVPISSPRPIVLHSDGFADFRQVFLLALGFPAFTVPV